LIGGPSAGAATTVATIAALQSTQVKHDVAITGTIEEDGYVGQVSSVFDKAIAADKNGMALLLVPRGQKKSDLLRAASRRTRYIGILVYTDLLHTKRD
jgi:predicted S18 family serine protease